MEQAECRALPRLAQEEGRKVARAQLEGAARHLEGNEWIQLQVAGPIWQRSCLRSHHELVSDVFASAKQIRRDRSGDHALLDHDDVAGAQPEGRRFAPRAHERFDGHGRLVDPKLNIDGRYEERSGYITDLLNDFAVRFLDQPREKPFSLFFAHKAVHPDAFQAADGTLDLDNDGGYKPAERHQDLYKGGIFPRTPNMLAPREVVKQKPVWAEAFELKKSEKARALLDSIHAGTQEEIRLRAAMMASVDEGVGMTI